MPFQYIQIAMGPERKLRGEVLDWLVWGPRYFLVLGKERTKMKQQQTAATTKPTSCRLPEITNNGIRFTEASFSNDLFCQLSFWMSPDHSVLSISPLLIFPVSSSATFKIKKWNQAKRKQKSNLKIPALDIVLLFKANICGYVYTTNRWSPNLSYKWEVGLYLGYYTSITNKPSAIYFYETIHLIFTS